MPEVNAVSSIKPVMTNHDLSPIEGGALQVNSISTTSQTEDAVSNENGKTLLDLFSDDVVTDAPKSRRSSKLDPLATNETDEEDSFQTPVEQPSSFLDKILPWRWFSGSKSKEEVDASAGTEVRVSKGELINHVPELEAPEGVVINPQQLMPLPKASGYHSSKFSSAELAEALSSISDKTLGEIMAIVVKAQLKLEQDFAVVTDQLFDKNQSYVKIHQEMLEEVNEKLQKDIKWAELSKTIQKGVFVVVAIASFAYALASLAGQMPALAALLGGKNIVDILGVGSDRVFKWSSAIMLSLATGTTKYLTWKSNEDSGRHEEVKHMLHRYEDRQKNLREHIASLAESDQQYKDYLSRELKRMKKLVKVINRQY